MADRLLTFEHGEVRLGNKVVPGVLKSQSVRGAVRFDEAKQDGLSGKARKTMGWEDADITLGLELLTDDDASCYDRLAELNAIFRAFDDDVAPRVYDVTNAHLRARGVDQVVFSGLVSNETDTDDVITCTLTFVEHIPAIANTEKRDVADGGPAAPQTNTSGEEVQPDPSIMVEMAP
ncbi:MAG: hypothetical protein SWH61_05280 [Thermodesulfobacteriota bacterium]|nr:hypothetical protein [Thermodesulfobacteriota bacterium]